MMLLRRIIFPLFLAMTFFGGNFVAADEPEKSDAEPQYLLVVGYDHGGGIKIFNALTGECVRDLSSLDMGPRPIRTWTKITAFPDGKRILVPAGNGRQWADAPAGMDEYNCMVFIIDVKTGKILRNFGRRTGDHAVVSPNGKYVVSAYYPPGHPEVKLWDVGTGKVLKTWRHPNADGWMSWKAVSFSPDGKNVVVVRGGMAQIWEVSSGKAVATLRLKESHDGCHDIRFSPDGKYLGCPVGVWEIETKNRLHTFDWGQSFAWAPDGKSFIRSHGWEKFMYHIHDTKTGEVLKELSPGGHGGFALDWSADGKYIALGQWSGKAVVYDVENDRFLKHLGEDGNVGSLTFIPFSAAQQTQDAPELLKKGMDYLEIGQKELAVEELTRVAEANPDMWEADFVTGLIEAFSNHRVTNAHAAFSRCTEKSQEAAVLNNFAVTSMLQEKTEDALTAWETLAENEELPPDAVMQNVGLLMERVNKQLITGLTAEQTKRLIDLHIKLRKVGVDVFQPADGWQFMPLEGVTDNSECEEFFTKKASPGKAKDKPYEWK